LTSGPRKLCLWLPRLLCRVGHPRPGGYALSRPIHPTIVPLGAWATRSPSRPASRAWPSCSNWSTWSIAWTPPPDRLGLRAYQRPDAFDGPTQEGFLDTLDVVGYNYLDRWAERRKLYYSVDHTPILSAWSRQ
jgi:hypothetical protein